MGVVEIFRYKQIIAETANVTCFFEQILNGGLIEPFFVMQLLCYI